METTIDIAGSILSQAQRLAAERGTTLEALIEEGLREVLMDRREKHGFSWQLDLLVAAKC